MPDTMKQWITTMTEIGWAYIRANLFAMRCPWKYNVASKSSITFWRNENAIDERIVFVGVVQDIPDVTEYSIIHKLVPIRTYYGKWEQDED